MKKLIISPWKRIKFNIYELLYDNFNKKIFLWILKYINSCVESDAFSKTNGSFFHQKQGSRWEANVFNWNIKYIYQENIFYVYLNINKFLCILLVFKIIITETVLYNFINKL